MFKKNLQKNFQKKSLKIHICKVTKFIKEAKKILQEAKEKFEETKENNLYLEHKHSLFYIKITLNQSMQKELILKKNTISGENFQIIIKNYEKILKILRCMNNGDIISKKNHDFLLQIKAFKQDNFVKNYKNVKQKHPLQKFIDSFKKEIEELCSNSLENFIRKMIDTLQCMQKNEFISKEDHHLLMQLDGWEKDEEAYLIIKDYKKINEPEDIYYIGLQ